MNSAFGDVAKWASQQPGGGPDGGFWKTVNALYETNASEKTFAAVVRAHGFTVPCSREKEVVVPEAPQSPAQISTLKEGNVYSTETTTESDDGHEDCTGYFILRKLDVTGGKTPPRC